MFLNLFIFQIYREESKLRDTCRIKLLYSSNSATYLNYKQTIIHL